MTFRVLGDGLPINQIGGLGLNTPGNPPPPPPSVGVDVIEANFNSVWLDSYFSYGGPDEAVSLDELIFFDC